MSMESVTDFTDGELVDELQDRGFTVTWGRVLAFGSTPRFTVTWGRDAEIAELRKQLAAAQDDALEQARIVGMTIKREIDLREQLTEARTIIKEKEGQRQNLMEAFSRQGDSAQEEICRLRKQVTLLREALAECKKLNGMDRPVSCAAAVDEALAATQLITNYGDGSTRRRNADDMGNPPANAAELLNARKPKP